MPKQKSHKGLLKRVKITARGKVKFHSAFAGHLRSKKRGVKIQQLRKKRMATAGDVTRFEKMLHRDLKPG